MLIINLFIFIFGLMVGSFINVVICRLETGEGVIAGRSHCPHCQKTLKWFDLIPLLSFIFLKGRCRYCKQKISLQYPLVELATGLLFILVFWNLEFGIWNLEFFNTLYLLIISCFLIIIFAFDLKHFIIPDKIVFPAILITLLYKLFGIWDLGFGWSLGFGHWDFILAAFLASGFFLAIVFLTKGKGMGMGDVKFAFLMGLVLGWPNILLALFIAFMFGAVVGLALIFSKKKTLKSEVPFGPFLCVGTFLTLFYSEQIINWYWGLF